MSSASRGALCLPLLLPVPPGTVFAPEDVVDWVAVDRGAPTEAAPGAGRFVAEAEDSSPDGFGTPLEDLVEAGAGV
jgi:hypothetical protein